MIDIAKLDAEMGGGRRRNQCSVCAALNSDRLDDKNRAALRKLINAKDDQGNYLRSAVYLAKLLDAAGLHVTRSPVQLHRASGHE